MSARRTARVLAIAVLGAVGVALAAGAFVRWAPRRTPAGQPPLERLDAQGIGRIAALFDADPGSTKLLVLLSPT